MERWWSCDAAFRRPGRRRLAGSSAAPRLRAGWFSMMKPLDSRVLDLLWFDADARETMLRQLVAERLAASPPAQAG